MKQLQYFVILLLGWFPPENAFSQSRPADSLFSQLEAHRMAWLKEKLFVHLDENFHLAGEHLWFKIYTVDADHRYLDISKVAYLEILDASGKAIIQTKVELKGGTGSGVVRIPSVPTAFYQVRAYTSWMQNFGEDYFFRKNIRIVNTLVTPDNGSIQEQQKFQLEFFPEGGQLLMGKNSRIAFRGRVQGQGVEFRGYILNNRNDTIVHFSPLKFGLGRFDIRTEEGQTYRAVVVTKDGVTQSFPVPAAAKVGFSMRLDFDNSELRVQIQKVNVESDVAYVIVHRHEKKSFASGVVFGDEEASVKIPLSFMPEGISNITVFDSKMRPLAERLYFKRPADEVRPMISFHEQDIETRSKVTMDLSAEGISDSDSVGLSVAVAKVYPDLNPQEADIRSWLWLGSELNGNVDSPNYYLESNEPEVAEATDNLMLTHGWRRFRWEALSADLKKQPSFLPEYHGHLIRARVTDTLNRPVRGVLTYLSSPGKASRIYPAYSDENGEVKYETLSLKGSRKIVLQADPSQDSTISIRMLSPFAPEPGPLMLPAFRLSRTYASPLRERSIAMQILQLYEVKMQYQEPDDTTNFYGLGSEFYRLDDYTRFTIMEEVMREYVKGIWIRKRSDGFHFQVHDNLRHKVFVENPLILMDGVPVFSANRVMRYDPLLVSRLELVTSKYYLGPLTFYGIVSYHTYKGDLVNFQLDPSSIVIDYEALQKRREFYAPDYERSKADRRPDQRSLLAWIPTVWLKPGQHKQIVFYTSDLAGNFEALVQGISITGKSGGGKAAFRVRRAQP